MEPEDVLRAEAEAIRGHAPMPDQSGREFNIALNKLNTAALCLSGGGIRSASFALGVIQALASHPRSSGRAPVASAEKSLLAKFDYLSTVSGGGYIGSWLSAWRLNIPFSDIWSALIARPGRPDVEPHPVAWLRSFSNYLTPKVGLMSADTWAALALLIRNLLLNWLVILPLIGVVILAVQIIGVASTWVVEWQPYRPVWSGPNSPGFYAKLASEFFSGIAALVLLWIALVLTLRGRPSWKSLTSDPPNRVQFIRGPLLLSFLSALFLVNFLASDFVGLSMLECSDQHRMAVIWRFWPAICEEHAKADDSGWLMVRAGLQFPLFAVAAATGGAVYMAAWLYARGRQWWRDFKGWRDLVAWTASGGVYGALTGLTLYVYLITPDSGIGPLQLDFIHLVFGVTMVLLSQVSADMIFVGLTSYEGPNLDSDADREWSGRSAGWFVAIALAWTVLTFLVFFGTIISGFIEDTSSTILEWEGTVSAIGAVSGVAAAFFSRSGLASGKRNTAASSSRVVDVALPVVAGVFAAALIITISYLITYGMFGDRLLPEKRAAHFWLVRFAWLSGGFLAAAVTLAVASMAIDINRFSLHAVYRNRLIRAFLGASRDNRKADPFTGFDPADNPPVHRLWSADQKGWRPFHVINIALNIVSSERMLAWQERKAAPFTVSPLHAGSSVVGYQKSREYGGGKGISLGTAMAISGAAASPNMGYHSSPAITFLMTMLNVRLGWWLANPGPSGKGAYHRRGPLVAIVPLVQEAFGLTSADTRYVYLSDGGHFENLGLYEMVRRRCRYIVVSDAGCDASYQFEDLGNAVRKIAIDLGVQITFRGLEDLKPRPGDGSIVGAGNPYHAIGEIDYRSADGGGRNGFIIYIKAGYHGCENAGTRGYANVHPDFPHERTINQWFTEAQFESYRALGFEITDGILTSALSRMAGSTEPALDEIFAALCGNVDGRRDDPGGDAVI